jgi:hypothetical protein
MTTDTIEPLPGLVLPRCTYTAMGRRCSMADGHAEGSLHWLRSPRLDDQQLWTPCVPPPCPGP